MRLSCALVVLTLLARAAAAEDDLEIPGLDATDMRGDALVWEDAVFYFEPWDSGASLRFYSPIGKTRGDEVGRAIPIRIVDATMRDFVEIAMHGRADCTWRKLSVDKRLDGLRMFVRREDLAPVLVKPFGVVYSDGTKVKLAAGTPVMPTRGGDYLVMVKNERFHVPIPHAFVGWVYKPVGKLADPELPANTKYATIDRSGTNAKLGDESFQIRSRWTVPMPDKKTDVAFVQLSQRCLEMTVSVPVSSLRAGEPLKPGSPVIPTPSAGDGWRIPTGAALATVTGRDVAVAAMPIAVTAPTSQTACFDSELRLLREDEVYQTQRRTFRLCARAADLEGASSRPATPPPPTPKPVLDLELELKTR